jgi:general nucleoside transport system ATP-binding protein
MNTAITRKGVNQVPSQLSPYAIEVHGLSKRFGATIANDQINLSVSRGEILALLGENGSGKTTLMNMLSGIYQPDSGIISLNGKPVSIPSPRDAIRLGIGMIHQHFKLVDLFTARQNILLGAGKRKIDQLNELRSRFGLNIDLDKKVYNMSVSEKQTVEIIKVLARGAEIMILDEPTAVLTPQEIISLFSILRIMRDNGCAVIIITHKLDEVLAVSDRVTVLRKGRSVATVLTRDTDEYKLTEMMVGHAVDLDIKRVTTEKGETLLDVHHVSIIRADGVQALRDVSFELYGGEILGIAGVAGSGQKELCEAIAGLQAIQAGSILLENKRIDGLTPREIITRGISMSFIPEDRLGMGLVGNMSISDNLLLKKYKEQKGFLLRRRGARNEARELIDQLSIVTPGINEPVRRLSGGNVQKVLLGREINACPRVLITAYPVRGLDINSSMTIYDLLNKQKKSGVGVLFIGEDLDVLLALCDRIIVLCSGRITAITPAQFATKELLGLKMAGALSATEKEDEYA